MGVCDWERLAESREELVIGDCKFVIGNLAVADDGEIFCGELFEWPRVFGC